MPEPDRAASGIVDNQFLFFYGNATSGHLFHNPVGKTVKSIGEQYFTPSVWKRLR